MKPIRFDYLDSVRGLAAFWVLLFHLNGIEGAGALTTNQTLVYNAVFNGHHAVSVFFVLSGLVLSYKYLKMSELQLDYKHFIFKRFYRLYPAYWVSLLILNIVLFQQHLFAKIADVVDFLKEASLFRNHFATFGGGWTLNIEMGISLLLPVFIVVMRYSRQWFWYFTLFSLLLSAYFTTYLFLFSLGIWLAADFDSIQAGKYHNHFLHRYRYALMPFGFMLFSGQFVFSFLENTDVFQMFKSITGFEWHQVSGFMAFLGLVWVIGSSRWQRFLHKKPFLFLGKISYSLYLMQWLVIFVWVNPHFNWFQQQFHVSFLGTRLLMAVVSMSLTLVLATLLYYAIERPFIEIARKKY